MKFLISLSVGLAATVLLNACASEQTSVQPMGLTEAVNHGAPAQPSILSKSGKTTELKTDAKPPTWTQHPHFIPEERLTEITKTVTSFPATTSIEQRADELNLLSLQEMRTKADCARAATEVKTNLANFYGPPYGPLTKDEVEKLTPFFEQVRNDSGWFLYKIKNDRARKRPFAYIKELEPCVEKEISPSYPSGHATVSRVWALILSDLFPSKTKAILKRSDQIADDRVLAGMHHRSDIIAGQALGEQLYKEFVRSPDFRRTVASFETQNNKH